MNVSVDDAYDTRQPDRLTMILTATESECIWTCDSHNRTPDDAANEFARVYWDRSRRRRSLGGDGRFQMVGGMATFGSSRSRRRPRGQRCTALRS